MAKRQDEPTAHGEHSPESRPTETVANLIFYVPRFQQNTQQISDRRPDSHAG